MRRNEIVLMMVGKGTDGRLRKDRDIIIHQC